MTAAYSRRGEDKGVATVARVFDNIDEIVRLVRFPGWQQTSTGDREVKKALRKTLRKYKLHTDAELFEKAYGYVREYNWPMTLVGEYR